MQQVLENRSIGSRQDRFSGRRGSRRGIVIPDAKRKVWLDGLAGTRQFEVVSAEGFLPAVDWITQGAIGSLAEWYGLQKSDVVRDPDAAHDDELWGHCRARNQSSFTLIDSLVLRRQSLHIPGACPVAFQVTENPVNLPDRPCAKVIRRISQAYHRFPDAKFFLLEPLFIPGPSGSSELLTGDRLHAEQISRRQAVLNRARRFGWAYRAKQSIGDSLAVFSAWCEMRAEARQRQKALRQRILDTAEVVSAIRDATMLRDLAFEAGRIGLESERACLLEQARLIATGRRILTEAEHIHILSLRAEELSAHRLREASRRARRLGMDSAAIRMMEAQRTLYEALIRIDPIMLMQKPGEQELRMVAHWVWFTDGTYHMHL